MELYKLTVHEAKELLRKKEITARELTKSVLERIDKKDGAIQAYITIDYDGALKLAEKIDELFSNENAMPDMAGIPFALKDNISTQGMLTTCASNALKKNKPKFDAAVAANLKNAGGILLGKTNMDEFAIGSSGETSVFARTRNPWDTNKVPGGSSGGSAAATAADEALFAIGTDTGGSVRQPASFCGVVGMKPTFGLISGYGIMPFATSLDQAGTLTKDVTDCAMVLNTISGYDPRDSTSVDIKHPDYTTFLRDNISGLRIGVPKEYVRCKMKEDVRTSFNRSLHLFEKMGAFIEEISLPHAEYAIPAYLIVSSSEVVSNLCANDGCITGIKQVECKTGSRINADINLVGHNVKKRMILGTYILQPEHYEEIYLKALKVRTLIKNDFDKAFEKCELILSPTNTDTAFPFDHSHDNVVEMYEYDTYTIPVNMAGLPAISIPCGFDSKGLPIGLQLTGRPFDEGTLLRAAYTFEQNTDFHIKKPII